jgi:MEDS: MEthanogen/methylotroph, DcmR Sensory domain
MEHCARLYQELDDLAGAVAEYVEAGLSRGEAVVIIATEEHRSAFLQRLDAREALRDGRLNLLDAERTLERFMANGMPQWNAFQRAIGGLIAELRLQFPSVRAYGEMVDVLWQRGEREAAIRLEEYWNELGRLQTFSLLCAYRMSPFDAAQYGGALESVCRVHTQLVPARDEARFDEAVREAARNVLDEPLADILLSLAASHRTDTRMPAGQSMLFWLRQNMPRTAEKLLSELRAGASRAA